ncbi:MAG: hypothetical protein ACTSUE_24320, partial [Promethearchaeota archaeon]
GYVKYNITYTYYYYGEATFVKIDFDFGATPQRGTTGYPLNGYANDTGVYFKNYGDWPHLMQLVSADDTQPTKQDMKSWYGSKYGYFQEYIDARRRDYPLEPWTAWWDNDTGSASDPTIGIFAITEGVGWEVLSLAVNGIGNNSLLQQILPEGHQGDQFLLTNGTVLSYDYYMLTSPYGTNDTLVRDVAKRMNDPVIVEVSGVELFENNNLFVHVDDIDGVTALGTYVRVYNSLAVKVNDSMVNSVGNVTFQRLPDDSYTVEVYYFTENTGLEYVIRQDSFSIDHLTNRSLFLEYTCNVANLSFNVVNWARDDEPLTGAKVQLFNVTSGALVEQGFTNAGFVYFRLFTDGGTQYNIVLTYGGVNRTVNVTSPYTVVGNTNLNVGVQIQTTSITIINQNASVSFGNNYTLEFSYHKSSDANSYYDVDSVEVSGGFDSDYWVDGTDYSWVFDQGTNLTTLELYSGFTNQLNDTGQFEVYIHVHNASVESTIEKVFVIIDAKAADVQVLVNGTDITGSLIYDITQNASLDITVYYIDLLLSANITGTATVNISYDTQSWLMSPVGDGYNILINTTDLGIHNKYVFTIRCENQSLQTQIFRFTAFSTDVNTTIETLVNNMNQSALASTIVRLGDTINFSVAYNNLFTSSPVSGATVQVRYTNDYTTLTETLNLIYNAGTLTFTGDLVLDLSTFRPQSKLFTITGVLDGYESKTETFLVSIERLNSTMDVLVNGFNQSALSNEEIRLGDFIGFSVGFFDYNTLNPVLAATVELRYTNDFTGGSEVIVLVHDAVSGRYNTSSSGLELTLSNFTSQFKVFTITAQSDSYEWKTQTFVVNIKRISITPELDVTGNVTGTVIQRETGQHFTFRVRLVNTFDNTTFTDVDNITISIFHPLIGSIELVKETGANAGYFSASITCPSSPGTYELILIIEVVDYAIITQHEFTDPGFTLSVSQKESIIPIWVFYLLVGIIIGMIVYFILYQVRFKYPPLIRKIHDLKRSVSRGKRMAGIRPPKVKNREENIYGLYSKAINIYSFLQTKDSRFAARSAGYAPIPDESIELEFEMPSLDGAVPELESQVPPKKFKAAPVRLEKPVSKPVPALGAGVAPAVMSKPAVKQVKRPLPKLGTAPGPKPLSPPAKPTVAPKKTPTITSLPKPTARPPATVRVPRAKLVPSVKPINTDNLYQQLVLLEQKRYKAERSIRDLNAKHGKGQVTDDEFKEYDEKLRGSLEVVKEQINELRRRLISM